jgi:transposase
MMAVEDGKHSKEDSLREAGTLNLSAEKVRDAKFRISDFFDPRDIVQVKYEMLRRVRVEGVSVTEAAADASLSRPTYYQARANFEEAGIAGLVPKKRGPRGPHKLDDQILAFVEDNLTPGEPIRAYKIAELVAEEFGIELHPRTIERALREKKRPASRRHQPVRRPDCNLVKFIDRPTSVAMPICTFASRRCGRSSRTRRAQGVSTRFECAPQRWDGPTSRSS